MSERTATITVAVRIKPLGSGCRAGLVASAHDNVRQRGSCQCAAQPVQTITVKAEANDGMKAVTGNHQSSWVFGFNQVLENVSQEAMFDACAKDIVDSVISGYNGTLFACKYTF